MLSAPTDGLRGEAESNDSFFRARICVVFDDQGLLSGGGEPGGVRADAENSDGAAFHGQNRNCRPQACGQLPVDHQGFDRLRSPGEREAVAGQSASDPNLTRSYHITIQCKGGTVFFTEI